ncbi:hypothetical protein L3X38_004428 [Prunus dulcis]|uniref:Transposase-associated domain-containing protein n=1 Tax=Prunus dulcis TaxID=3755 RepID=A0AAD4ZNZ5_PRUDU|nr:hypothetical protein L3X38_004428 [Prunus dulcis]
MDFSGDRRCRCTSLRLHRSATGEMYKSWMHADRRSKAYELGVEGFLNFAVENLGNTTHILCPCVKSWKWTTNASRIVEEDEKSRFSFVSEEVGMDDNDLDDIGFDSYEFANVIGDGGDMLPKGNTLPSSMYEAKKILSALGVSYEKIHACPNDCILYKKDYEIQLIVLLVVSQGGWKAKIKILKEGVPAKGVWYFPPISRFKRMFQSHTTAKSLTWYAARKLVDGQMSHPVDSSS